MCLPHEHNTPQGVKEKKQKKTTKTKHFFFLFLSRRKGYRFPSQQRTGNVPIDIINLTIQKSTEF